jgi:diguanylate cyclase (GGDEF)-like protein
MGRSLRVLLIIDPSRSSTPILRELRRGGFSPVSQRVATADEVSLALARQSWDLIIADTTLPQFPCDAARTLLRKSRLQIPLVPIPLKANSKLRGNSGAERSAPTGGDEFGDLFLAVEHKLRSARRSKRENDATGVLRYLAEYDPLTDLPNRNYFHEQLQRRIQVARKDGSNLAILILGLERFREINHTLGRQNGDAVLREVARRFAIATRAATIGRLSGTEFAVILPRGKKKTVAAIASKLRRMFEAPCFAKEIPIDLSASMGAALYPEHGEDADSLIQRSHIALDRARQSGKEFAIYRPADDPYGQQKLAYLGGLRGAIDQCQLVLHYQPKVNLETKRTDGVEALVRWNHPQIGLVQPRQFIYIAERTGLIHALTQWVLCAALDQCQQWHLEGLEIPVAVNLSPRNFHDPRLPESICLLLKERNLPPRSLELEITESVLMADAVHVSRALGRLSELGVRTYIDDFGAGYSSLGYLKKLPVAGIKIDQAFVRQMILDDNDAVIVRSTIELGHNLGLKVVAEGVESTDICDRLSTLHCDGAQGFSMCRPKPASELDHWFAESPWGIEKAPTIPEHQN